MRIAGTGFSHIGISSKKILSHSASSASLSKAMNSDFMVDLASTVCLIDFHDIAATPSVKPYPHLEFEFLESDIQLASLYRSKTNGMFTACARSVSYN